MDEEKIKFGMFLTGHDYETIKKMLGDYERGSISRVEDAREASDVNARVNGTPAWKGVDETPPPENTVILTCDSNDGGQFLAWLRDRQWHNAIDGSHLGRTITHWMELPKPPNDKT